MMTFEEWFNSQKNLSPRPWEVWDACLQECAKFCREFGEEISRQNFSTIYIEMQYSKCFEELAKNIEQNRSEK